MRLLLLLGETDCRPFPQPRPKEAQATKLQVGTQLQQLGFTLRRRHHFTLAPV